MVIVVQPSTEVFDSEVHPNTDLREHPNDRLFRLKVARLLAARTSEVDVESIRITGSREERLCIRRVVNGTRIMRGVPEDDPGHRLAVPDRKPAHHLIDQAFVVDCFRHGLPDAHVLEWRE